MSEFLWRGYNVAIPEVDRGDDIFVVHDDDGTLHRVQVKTATGAAYTRNAGCRAQFSVTWSQLATLRQPDLNYVFAIRHAGRWQSWFLATRQELFTLHRKQGVGRRIGDSLLVRFAARPDRLVSNGLDLTAHRDAWDRYWPPLI